MKRRGNWLAGLPTIIAVGWWVVDKLLPDLLPPVPRPLAWTVVAVATTAIVAALAIQTGHGLRRRAPGPWLAQPVWRSVRWIRERPRLSILTAAANAVFSVSTLDALTIRLTVHRNVRRTRGPSVISFEDAVLTLVQHQRGIRRAWRLRPTETGGFLSLPLAPGRSDTVMIDFDLIALPLASSHAPDLHSAYSLELDRVRATLPGRRPVAGRLPKAAWSMAPPS